MKQSVYGILKARFLINEDAIRNWRFILVIIGLAIIMIGNTHRYEQKTFEIVRLTDEINELRSEFVDRRSELMRLKMESTVALKMQERGIFPTATPPQKIKVTPPEETNWFKKLWQ